MGFLRLGETWRKGGRGGPWLAVLFLASFLAAEAWPQEAGKIRLLPERASHVIDQRNRFVTGVLSSYAIPHECNAQGAVVRIQTDGKWRSVTGIEIVPLVEGRGEKGEQVVAHELLFHTPGGILALHSEIVIR